ncbi:hypothetical protein [Streptomyces sp. NPDC000931]|uniref:hypothetical protein n=1 Tax=Streptomyces sp. NPDC000931 TaxID=3154372 RepID=UPI00332B8854
MLKRIVLSRRRKLPASLAATAVPAGVATAGPAHDPTAATTAEGRFLQSYHLEVKGVIELVEQTLTIQPGEDTSWHVQPRSDRADRAEGLHRPQECQLHREGLPPGSSFIKQGSVPLSGVNEGSEPIELHLTYLNPKGTPLRYAA